MPEIASRLALARDFWLEGIRRYGFHGLSCESIVRKMGTFAPRSATHCRGLASNSTRASTDALSEWSNGPHHHFKLPGAGHLISGRRANCAACLRAVLRHGGDALPPRAWI